ncbi:hypothetical protein LBMAG41_14210 [Cyanobium sp.]|nr:hypothetical protein LBMAG41_14210 [Cyanobium sp.]
MEAALGLLEGPLGKQQQQPDQLLAPAAGLPEHIQGLIEGSPLALLVLLRDSGSRGGEGGGGAAEAHHA